MRTTPCPPERAKIQARFGKLSTYISLLVGYTDYPPIVLPTEAGVEAVLRGTSHLNRMNESFNGKLRDE